MIPSDVIRLDRANTDLGHDLRLSGRREKWTCTRCTGTVSRITGGPLTGSALDQPCPTTQGDIEQ